MGRRTILTQKEMEAFIKNPPIGFISLGAGLILPCIFLGDIIPYYMKLLFVIIGIISILVGIMWLFCRIDFKDNINVVFLNFNTRTCNNESFYYISRLSKRDKIIVDNSDKIKALMELNKQVAFKSYSPTFNHFYRCKNKREFDNLNIRNFFFNCVHQHYSSYSIIKECVRDNITKYDYYLKRLETLTSTVTEELCQQLDITKKKFQKREQKIFQNLTHRPPLRHVDIYCEIIYTSPQGRNHYKNTAIYNLSQLESTLQSIKSQKSVQETKEYKIKQERSKMSASLRYDILKRDNFKCQICGATQNDGVTLHVDHIVPVSKGGKTEWSNLRTLCERCNLGKSDKYEEVVFSQKSVYPVENYQEEVLNHEKTITQIVELISMQHFMDIKKVIIEQLAKYDDIKDASKKHFFILAVLDHIYQHRDNQECMDIIKNICDIDISNIANLCKTMGIPFYMVTPTKRAIILERENEIERAIEICELCERYKVWDSDKKSFSLRRAKLEEKLVKIKQGHNK